MKRVGVDDRSQKLKEQFELNQVIELQESIAELELEIVSLKETNKSANDQMNLYILDIEELNKKYNNKEIEINELKLAHEKIEYKSELKINSYQNEIEVLNLGKKNENAGNADKCHSNTAVKISDEIIFDNISLNPNKSNTKENEIEPHIEVQSLQNIFPSVTPDVLNSPKKIIKSEMTKITFPSDDRNDSRRSSGSMSVNKKGISSAKSVLLQQVCRKSPRFFSLLSDLILFQCNLIYGDT